MRPTARVRSLMWQLGGLACLVWLTGCGSVQSVPISDPGSPGYAVRATFRGTSGDPARRAGAGVELGYEGYRASSTQTLAPGESISHEGGTIFGPESLRHHARLQQGYVAYNHLLRFGTNLELEPFVGVTRLSTKVTTERATGTTVDLVDRMRTGVTGGVTPRWRFNDWVAIEARLNYFHTDFYATGQNYEAAIVMSPAANVSLRLGYSERRMDIETPLQGLRSEISVRARGPLATLQLDF